MTAIHPFDVQARTELAAGAESIEAMASANACFPGYPTTAAPAASVHPVTNLLLAGRPLGPVVVNNARRVAAIDAEIAQAIPQKFHLTRCQCLICRMLHRPPRMREWQRNPPASYRH